MFKLSKRDNEKLKQKALDDIKHLRKWLKEEPIAKKMFNDYKQNIDDIDTMSIQFVDGLDVSAKTINGKIYLNAEMLKDDWKKYRHYLLHETNHRLQHLTNKCNNSDADYLDNPQEIEAFKRQIEFREKTDGKKVVNKYLDELFDKHNLDDNERKKKRKELLGE